MNADRKGVTILRSAVRIKEGPLYETARNMTQYHPFHLTDHNDQPLGFRLEARHLEFSHPPSPSA